MITAEAVDLSASPRIIPVEALTPDVSSTDIRLRAARGEAIDHLVPKGVAEYIRQYQLYAAPDAPGALKQRGD
jgi:nicotinic acid mononucleotide adenylyltransferase